MRSQQSEKSSTRIVGSTLMLVLALAAIAVGIASGAGGAASSNGLAYSTSSARSVQRQPAPGACRARGAGLYALADARCTPGSLNPHVTQTNIAATICRRGWTSTVRPPESITAPEKRASMSAYGFATAGSAFEYDHLVPLELGGAVNDAHNLWPEPDAGIGEGFYRNPKDRLERALNRLVCAGTMTLSQAQKLVATDWVAAFRRYG
jgi:hypothetical protein